MIQEELPLFKDIVMWSFPIVSLALGLLSWRRVHLKLPLVVLMAGLALQTFSYLDWRVASGVNSYALVALGKGFFVGLLYVLLGTKSLTDLTDMAGKAELYSRVQLKVILLSGMIFLTLSNLVSPKISEALLAILLILFPAIFWTKVKAQDPMVIASILCIGVLAFCSFFLTWSGYLLDVFSLSPILWMLAFGAGFYVFLDFEEKRGPVL